MKIPDYSLTPEAAPAPENSLEGMSQRDLLDLHSKIEARLKGKNLEELNLVQETAIQFQKAKELQADAADRKSDVPMNQRAQVQNTISNVLDRLGKMQMELYSSEVNKRLKAAVVKVMKEQPKDVQERFWEMLQLEFDEVAEDMA